MQTLGLIIAAHGVKPAVAMKTLLTTFAFLGLAAAAIIAVASCCTQTIPPNQNVEMFLGDPNANPPKYVELKPGAEGKLRAALAKIKGHNGICEITFLDQRPGDPRTLITVKKSMYASRLTGLSNLRLQRTPGLATLPQTILTLCIALRLLTPGTYPTLRSF